MAYTAPTITGSSATFSQLLKNGVSGHVKLLIAANTFTAAQASILRAMTGGFADRAMQRYISAVRDYMQGDPTSQAASIQIILDFNTVFAALSAQAAELGVLVTANPGTLSTKANGVGHQQAYRKFS